MDWNAKVLVGITVAIYEHVKAWNCLNPMDQNQRSSKVPSKPVILWFHLNSPKAHLVPPPAMGRDTFHCPRLLQAPSSLALDTARDPGAATAALGTLCQGLPTLTGNNSFPISHPALPSGSGKPFPVSCPCSS